jgi:hypothetical protein
MDSSSPTHTEIERVDRQPDGRFLTGNKLSPGRKSAGASIREWLTVLSAKDLDETGLRAIARGGKEPVPKRIAAKRLLAALEAPDLADIEPVLNGSATLAQLRDAGVDTSVVKRLKVKRAATEFGEAVEVEAELHDRSLKETSWIADNTDGKPMQSVKVEANLPQQIVFVTPLTRHRILAELEKPADPIVVRALTDASTATPDPSEISKEAENGHN